MRFVIGEMVYKYRRVILLAWLAAAVLLLVLVSPPDAARQEVRSFLPADSPFLRAVAQFEESFPANAGLSRAVVIFERRDGELTPADQAVILAAAGRILAPLANDEHLADLEGVRLTSPADYSPLPWRAGGLLPRNPFVSDITSDGQAAILRVQIPANYVTTTSARTVEHIRHVLSEMQNQTHGTHNAGEMPASRETDATPWPAGLSVAVTGSSGVGFDYAQAARAGERQTLLATLAAVTVILLLVYRSPLAAAVPLVCISLAAIVATRLLSLGHYAGLHIGLAENIFVVVLIYGAGIDYSLLYISRFREYAEGGLRGEGVSPSRPAGILATTKRSDDGLPAPDGEDESTYSTDHTDGTHSAGGTPAPRDPTPAACSQALSATLPAIAAAAGINILGLLMLAFARFTIFRSTGHAVAIALTVALAAALTLLPACVGSLGGRLFWPTRIRQGVRPSRLWTAVGDVVTRRPGLVLIVTLLALSAPAYLGTRQHWVYDTLEALHAHDEDGVGNSARGAEIAQRHWPIGELAPVETLITTSKPLTASQWRDLTRAVRDDLKTLPLPQRHRRDVFTPVPAGDAPANAVVNIRSLADPLGWGQPLPALGQLMKGVDDNINKTYLSDDRRATYMELILATQPFSLQAMDAIDDIRHHARAAAEQALRELGIAADVNVYFAGPTAETAATRDVTQRDFYLVAGLVLGVILVMLLALLRDIVLSLWMIGSTILSYFATLGLCSLVFVTLGPFNGLDWKLEIFLFVVMVAVGQDYNIFLATRLMQERAAGLSVRDAARRAMTFTGPVISSCGLIMAATLGSLMVGELALMVQLGFAMALGMLIDTFLVRPLLLPAFCCVTGRTGRRKRIATSHKPQATRACETQR